MKGLIWIIVLFVVAVALVLGAQYYSGNVYIVTEETTVRVNLHLFVGVMLLTVVLLYVLLRLVLGTAHLPKRVSGWYSEHQTHKSVVALNHAGLAYFEGKFEQAETQAGKVLQNKRGGDNKTLALMLAAHSADQMDDTEARDAYLHDLAGLPEKQQLSRYLLLAESALAKRDYVAAEKAIQGAAAINPNLTRLVKLQLRYAFDQNHADAVLETAGKLNRAGALSEEEYNQYSLWAYREWLSRATTTDLLKTTLKRIPADVREQDLSVVVAEKYVQLGMYPQVVKWVKKLYPRQHEAALLPPLLQAAQYLGDKEQQKIMDVAEDWLKDRPQDAQLLLALGEMAYGQQLWGKAQSYLEASLGIQDGASARLVLAKVLDQSGDHSAAQAQRNHVLASLDSDDEL
ncbi:heme biosynthesis HemY N-terminal domain-containing protein [Snodgrassella sp. CFCC 13594]|uniref:heme biosynthesis HemY N-terminal domain-containing protein n=1 Tax=Snodgrassella sp. CFCC 13594 TaxID=1775559 RepID=UPI000830530C|nr:heme biosynthesis HemY N-terminal domain-containing protein [Snodgrassella sp. CFCC 13594]